ncbi:hypothetical protein QJS10_CPA08g01661 [Acorus calamus]|uniref:BHLH domain-containing protein n=1 Tax=Acorus calamus TaxID=4465 RepID=A0AAV9EB87_ACOCL|nr:hypothetical protein QJS10_CPA08g01661 [Acorus calamus]
MRRTSCRSTSGAISRRRGRCVLRRRSLQNLHEELRMLIPGGGRRLRSEELLSLTADYIMFLRFKVNVLRAISEMYMP